MKILYFILLLLVLFNLFIYLVGGLFNKNLHKKYKKLFSAWGWIFLLIMVILYVLIIFIGLAI